MQILRLTFLRIHSESYICMSRPLIFGHVLFFDGHQNNTVPWIFQCIYLLQNNHTKLHAFASRLIRDLT